MRAPPLSHWLSCIVLLAVSALAQAAPPERFTVDADGHPLALWRRAVEQPKGVIVLIHGRTWSSLPNFDLQVPDEERSVMAAFNAKGYTAYALDLRGYGKSPRDSTGWLTPDRAARDVRITLEWLAREQKVERPALLGWSMGSLVAQLTAQRAPAMISSLILYGYPRDPGAPFAVPPTPDTPAREATTRERAVSDFISPNVISPRAIDAYAQAALAADPVRVDWNHLEELAELDPAKVTVPTLVIHGERDPLTPVAAQANLFTRLGTADRAWIILAGADHAAMLEDSQPRFVTSIVAFTDRTVAAKAGTPGKFKLRIQRRGPNDR
jgi:pimeloyl-ACP methyl ester carboxylesterase